MQVLSSLKTAKTRHRDCQIVRRRGKVYVICKSNPRSKHGSVDSETLRSQAEAV